ncbi:hypothetical protein [Pedobacter sp. N23S346]|uniref:hypothetical protein n=1 Tax=Pedobacter sp. N23S346 TaxID=3402750 RepID=UPI003AC176EE
MRLFTICIFAWLSLSIASSFRSNRPNKFLGIAYQSQTTNFKTKILSRQLLMCYLLFFFCVNELAEMLGFVSFDAKRKKPVWPGQINNPALRAPPDKSVGIAYRSGDNDEISKRLKHLAYSFDKYFSKPFPFRGKVPIGG